MLQAELVVDLDLARGDEAHEFANVLGQLHDS